eukprot:CAMPEP_0185724464 /NCGR_PEP_ID=MMETSP1171-20130828/934_1 /TAXON_ID=374046 /ORGANISM="Helicotheca tamensis, Strain CCMP826" /LENGTH=336 /DNA_ID=CAMNT_0028392317 /DNA_START=92 /DNA_END=1102 /DNA_ORIENTATION=-
MSIMLGMAQAGESIRGAVVFKSCSCSTEPSITHSADVENLPPVIDELAAVKQEVETLSQALQASIEKLQSLKREEPLPSFTDLLIESGSDKYYRHHYERYYEGWLEPYRNVAKLKMLEIGADQGKSIELWKNYFTNHELVMGLAYGDHVLSSGIKDRGVEIHYGDQSKHETMNALMKKGPWDVIIDDGSHFPGHTLYSLFALWEAVKPGGIYVIEDLETSYWDLPDAEIYSYKLNHTGIGAKSEYSTVAKIQELEQVLVRHQIGAEELSVMPGDHSICSIEWGMNLVKIHKCGVNDGVGPDYLPRMYEQDKMRKWVKAAKRTNPMKDANGNFVPFV